MKIGDLVQFNDHQSTYAKWFYSQMAEVVTVTNGHCRVRWLNPVKYFNNYATVSDFKTDVFEIIG